MQLHGNNNDNNHDATLLSVGCTAAVAFAFGAIAAADRLVKQMR